MAQLSPHRADCRKIRAQLSGYLDRELEPHIRACIALHLAACPGCRREERLLAAVIAALHRLPACRGAWRGE